MKKLFSPEGENALDELCKKSPLIAFDFDGTLAPIMDKPESVQTSPAIAQALGLLAQVCPVVVITGRSVADVSGRLGFQPQLIVGNHGAEGLNNSSANGHLLQVGAWREAIESTCGEALKAAGVQLEDKAYSLALHYRLAQDPDIAQRAIAQATALVIPEAKIFGGKCVVNIVPADAPDKAEALSAVMRGHGTDAAIFVGDDLNDESIFRRSVSSWVTVRIGHDFQSCAQYYLDQQSDVITLLQRMLRRLEARG